MTIVKLLLLIFVDFIYEQDQVDPLEEHCWLRQVRENRMTSISQSINQPCNPLTRSIHQSIGQSIQLASHLRSKPWINSQYKYSLFFFNFDLSLTSEHVVSFQDHLG